MGAERDRRPWAKIGRGDLVRSKSPGKNTFRVVAAKPTPEGWTAIRAPDGYWYDGAWFEVLERAKRGGRR